MLIELACYFPALDHPVFFTIDIDSNKFGSKLCRAIHDELKVYNHNVDLLDMMLYKTDISLGSSEKLKQRVLQWLHQAPAESQIPIMGRLATFFPEDLERLDDRLDIIVANAEVLEQLETLGDPNDVYRRKVKKALNERMDKWASLPSPSECALHPAAVLDVDEPIIRTGRRGGVPAVIFNPVLAGLQRDLDNLEQFEITPHDAQYSRDYVQVATAFYPNEDTREQAIRTFFDGAIGSTAEWKLKFTGFTPDAVWFYEEFVTMVLEFKNTLGVLGDATLQAAVDYAKLICSSDKYKRLREFCNFPVVLVGVVANRLEVSVAVSIGRIYLTRLLVIDLALDFHISNNIIRLARIFKALRRCNENLRKYYREVHPSKLQKLSCLYPDPTPIDSKTRLPVVQYSNFFSRAGQPTSTLIDFGKTTTAMYMATIESRHVITRSDREITVEAGQDVIVKFTHRYNTEAHDLLVKAGLAPELYFCECVIGDLFMVVMEHVNGKSIWQLQQEEETIPFIVGVKVEEAIAVLHGADIVFGDLRESNILYDLSTGRVLLVDLDWPGKDGESRYPAALNADNQWANDVFGHGIMLKAHDLWQVGRLKKLCSSPASD